MFPVSQIAQPCFKTRRVVFLDGFAVSQDAGDPRDGGPFPAAVQEGDVDVRVCGEVVCFAAFGVGVEDQVYAAGFLTPPETHISSSNFPNLISHAGKARFLFALGFCARNIPSQPAPYICSPTSPSSRPAWSSSQIYSLR
jgi:hypothetical protein